MSRKELKIKRNFSIEKNTFDYLNDIQRENSNINSMSSAIDFIAMEHKSKSDTTIEQMIKIIASEVARELKCDLVKIIKGINSADRNTQIVMEMLNGLFIKNSVGEILVSSVVKSEGLEIAEEAVRKRISKSRVRKLDNE
ncbi:MAG: hypothetical protein E7A11_18785 [Clostridium sp.]|uniref:hypothetical protein n=1 Tax=Clostridium sp. TaxID=1506 RepID=UPI002902DBAD|nr:hypothetical protein [Clostridium sp.]MBS7131865.1 hypothetical protein [Clostridium sp.]MDU1127297.1 hypothetical protein [Clostridium sp.]MDU2284193.1 hypothetical protein [Clostridium sp.]